MDVVQERDENNAVLATYTRDGNIGGILSKRDDNGDDYFFHYDGSGNVIGLTDENEVSVAEYAYDAYGNLLSSSGAQASNNSYHYSTKEYFGSIGLYNYGYRFYSSGLGRWINRDSVEEAGGLNLYAMVANNPINDVDPYGLRKVAYIMIGKLPTDDKDKKRYASFMEGEIQQAKSWFYSRGFDKVYVVRKATGAKMKKALSRSDTKGLWYFGHSFNDTRRLWTYGDLVSALNIKSWLNKRKLDAAVFHTCYSGTKDMRAITTGDEGYFWGTDQSYIPDAWLLGGTVPSWITHKFEEKR